MIPTGGSFPEAGKSSNQAGWKTFFAVCYFFLPSRNLFSHSAAAMNDVIANQIASYRARLACLDKPEHKVIWENQPPLILTAKVTQARALTDELALKGSRQSAPITGTTSQKRVEEQQLEDVAYSLGRAVALYATDTDDRGLAEKYELTLTDWRRMRDEALLQRARLLESDAGALVAGADATEAAKYGIDATSVADLKKEADDYQAYVTASQDAVTDRSTLTGSLRGDSRAVAAKFDEIGDLLLQYRNDPVGKQLIAEYQARGQVFDRGHGPGTEEEPEPGGEPTPEV